MVRATPADPSQWYGAVARYSQAKQKQAAASFADRVFRTIRSGASATPQDGQRVRPSAGPSVDPARKQINSLRLKASSTAAATECPTTVDCTLVVGSPVGRQVADRQTNGIRIDTIVIHDLESTYDAGVAGLANPTNPAATHYLMSSSGAVTQMVPTKDIAFHAGNYSTDLHSIGIEREGDAAHGAAWYTQAQVPGHGGLGAEYPAGLGASTQAPLSMYAIPTGQAYVATWEAAAADDYFPSSGAVVIGGKKMYTIQYNHRVALVYANDVTATTAVHHWENDGN
ncbi:N-acetylmuramoyl-L-alanine amidase [Streptomyces sp. NPDC101234]|uniref:N-acetylmuramoyl-L-alanine amidase n=1 Tax=Streptomyces sp. NPDC101234 TaxID=3366138 RepID=UPI003820851B